MAQKTVKYYERKIKQLNEATSAFWNAELNSDEERAWNKRHVDLLYDLAWGESAPVPPEEHRRRLIDMVANDDDAKELRRYWL